jgi:hypothetical protein
MMIACVCMCGAEVCGSRGVWSGGVRVWMCRRGNMGVGVRLRTVALDVWFGVCFVCGVVCVSLSKNDLDAEGGAAMAGAVQHLTSLTTLKYV